MADPTSNGKRSRYAQRAEAGRIGLTVEVPRALYERLQQAVIDEERSQAAIVRLALRAWFARSDAAKSSEVGGG